VSATAVGVSPTAVGYRADSCRARSDTIGGSCQKGAIFHLS
jgi:hypothetical protein